jgi:DNA-binding MarR family transcriptional regulator
MESGGDLDLIRRVMGSSHVFCTAMNGLLERTLALASDEPLMMSQVKLLLLVAHPGQPLKVTDVAEFLGVTNAAASRAIDRLVQRDLVDRSVSIEDRRAVELSLTPNGRELLDRFAAVRNRELLRLMGDYPASKLEMVAALMDELSVLLLDLEAAAEERCLRCGLHFRSGCVLRDVLGRECAVSSELYGTPGISE